MCEGLIKAFAELKNYPFIPKTKGRTVETEVADLIARHIGGTIVSKGGNETPSKFNARIGRLAKPYIILQPNGSQSVPDLRVVTDTRSVDIECKRSKNGKAMWNSGYPKADTVYVYNGNDPANTAEHTTYVLGADLITPDEETALGSMLDAFRGVKEKYNKGLLKDSKFRLEHIRPMYKETGQNRWLIHPEKRSREAVVLSHLDTFLQP
jgi:hypothetical protein